jgi:hypothetical protein
MFPATHRVPAPQPAGAFQKSQILRHTSPADPSLTQAAPVTQLVLTTFCVQVVFRAPVPTPKHAPTLVAVLAGTQNCEAVQPDVVLNAVHWW